MDAHAREILLGGGIRVDELLERCMGSEALLVRLLKKFPADSSFARLEEAFGRSDENAALEASHTLKGVCGSVCGGAVRASGQAGASFAGAQAFRSCCRDARYFPNISFSRRGDRTGLQLTCSLLQRASEFFWRKAGALF